MAADDSMPTSRACTKCLIDKPFSEFTKSSGGKYGLSSQCKGCSRLYYVANKDRVAAYQLARYHKLQEPKREEKAARKANILSKADKLCPCCREVKLKECFGVCRGRPDGLTAYCRACVNAKNKKIREEKPELAASWSKKWADANKDKVDAKRARWLAAHPGRETERAAKWRKENRQRLKETSAQYRARPSVRIHRTIRERLRTWIKTERGRTFDALDYTYDQLVIHLERQFLAGMSWANYGSAWHVDHIVPLSSFKVSGFYDPLVKQAWALSNLRPLWAGENLRKHAKHTHLI